MIAENDLLRLPSAVIGLDTETHLIAAEAVIPRMVCASVDAGDDQETATHPVTACVASACEPDAFDLLEELFISAHDASCRVIIQNAAFDLTVILRYCTDIIAGTQPGDPRRAADLRRLVFDVLDLSMDRELSVGAAGVLVSDTILREKLRNLSTHGGIDAKYGRELRYDLASLVLKYFGVDISAKKDGVADPSIWRLRYRELDGVPIAQWPQDAYQYALDDATWARAVWCKQEESRRPAGAGSTNSESLQVYSDCVLRLITSHGIALDRRKVAELTQRIEEEISPRKMVHLVTAGVLRSNNSIDMAALRERITAAWKAVNRLPMLTDKRSIATSAEVLIELKGVDPIIDLYAHRAEYTKLLTAFLPNLRGGVVFANYDVLKETGRTSSYGGDQRRGSSYPAVNIQQMPRENGVRECHIARPGWVLVSNDYSALELCATAQATYSLFGHSVHREKINAGYDLHTFLGAAIAMAVEPDIVDHASDVDVAYQTLLKKRKARIAKGDDHEGNAVYLAKKRANHYRSLAKPTGLGYPGMLGPETFVQFAKATYGVEVTIDQARQLRELWLALYPEMVEFRRWVGQQEDKTNGTYAYETPGFNRWRAGATFCATANGRAMQSLSADGAKRATAWVGRAMYGGLPEGHPYQMLEGCRIQAFIHDELIAELPDDDLLTERASLVAKVMVESMEISMPDVAIKVVPAAMRAWTKAAEDEWADDPTRPERIQRVYGIAPDSIPGVTGGTRRLVPWDDVHAHH